jgi:hypothetical protein
LNDEKGVDKTTTDESGQFYFNKIVRSPTLLGLLPHEPVIGQRITIKTKGKEYLAWRYAKHNYSENGELSGKPINIICEISRNPAHQGDVYGICQIK